MLILRRINFIIKIKIRYLYMQASYAGRACHCKKIMIRNVAL